MTRVFNRTKDLEKRRKLRNNMTKAEKVLWEELRKRQIDGHKFRRQFSVAGFIVDFYCPELKLAVEVDGSSHDDNQEYDAERTDVLNRYGIDVVRYRNAEVFGNIVGGLDDLLVQVEQRRN